MANLVVTSTATKISVDFGALSSAVGFSKGTWEKDVIGSVVLDSATNWVEVHTKTGDNWKVCYTAYADSLVIDSIDGVAPTSNSDLYTKIVALML